MSEKKWSLKDHKKEKTSLNYSRRMMDNFEGTHLGMSRRWTHKSGPMSTSVTKRWSNYGEIPRKYIIGLLKKFVGKSFEEFVKEFDLKIKGFKNINSEEYLKFISISELDDVNFHEGFKYNRGYDYSNKQFYQPYGGHKPFYVDSAGIICKSEIDKKSTNKKGFNKTQINYNRRLFIPKFKQVRNQGIKTSYSNRESYFLEEFRRPVYFFDAFVYIDGVVKKLPVYGCGIELFKEYNYYSHRHPDGKGFYKKKLDWSDSWGHTDDIKAQKIEEEWFSIPRDYIPGVKFHHSYLMITDNPVYQDLLKKVIQADAMCEDSTELRKKLSVTFSKIEDDFGMGEIYYFVKRKDYKKD